MKKLTKLRREIKSQNCVCLDFICELDVRKVFGQLRRSDGRKMKRNGGESFWVWHGRMRGESTYFCSL
jgi:hypothetical protein